MGDFVDRGFYSVETFLLLLALKVSCNLFTIDSDFAEIVWFYTLTKKSQHCTDKTLKLFESNSTFPVRCWEKKTYRFIFSTNKDLYWRFFIYEFISLGSLPRPDNVDPWQPRVPPDHPSIRVLRRVPKKVRQHHSLEILYRNIRLSQSVSHNRWKGKLLNLFRISL